MFGPIVKIKQKLNLPKLRQNEQQFETLLHEYDANSEGNQSFREFCGTDRSVNLSLDKKNPYGLQRIKSDKVPKLRPRNLLRNESLQSVSSVNLEREKTNQEWFENCQQHPGPHARVQFYNQLLHSYDWEECIILDYNHEQQKFKVRRYPEGAIVLVYVTQKNVIRQQIQFLDQDQELFEKVLRTNEAKKQFQRNQTHIRQQFRDIPDKAVLQLPNKIRQKLYRKFISSRKFELLNNLLDEVNKQFVNSMKACKVLDLSKYRQPQKRLNLEYNYEAIVYKIRTSAIMQSDVISADQAFMNRCQTRFQVRFPDTYPIEDNLLREVIETQFKELQKTISKERYYLISEIQDALTKNYNFFTSSEWNNTPLQKLLIKYDFMYVDYIHGLILESHKWILQFYESFNEGNQYTAKSFSYVILIPKKRITKKDKIQSQGIIEDDTFIVMSPSLEEVQYKLTLPNQMIKKIMMQNLTSDFMPLLLLQKKLAQNQDQQEAVRCIQEKTMSYIEEQYDKCWTVCRMFEQYSYLLEPIKKKIMNRIFGIEDKEVPILSSIKVKSIKDALSKLQNVKIEIQRQISDEISVGLFTVQTSQVKEYLIERAESNFTQIFTRMTEILLFNMQLIKQAFTEMYAQTSSTPTTEESLIHLKLFLDDIKSIFAHWSLEITAMQLYPSQSESFIAVYDQFSHWFDMRIFDDYISLQQWPYEIKESIRNNRKLIEQQERAFLQKLEQDKADFNEKIDKIQEQFALIKSYSTYSNVKDQVIQMRILVDQFDQATDLINSFNHREQLFRLPLSIYQQVFYLQEEFKPYQTLWDLAGDFEIQKELWLYGSFKGLSHQQIQLKITAFVNETIVISNYFKEIQNLNAQTVAREFRRSLDAFKQNIWVIECLAIEAFQKKPSLWRELFKECKMQHFDPKEEFSLQTLISRGILNVKEQVLQSSQRAEKGWNMEKRLNEMSEKLISIDIDVAPYRGTSIFKNYDEVQQEFDEQLNVLIMLKAQPHVKMVLGKANQLESKIVLIQDTLEFGMKCQRTWMYLDPIFMSEDIKNKLAKETNDFLKVDATFRNCMSYLNLNRNLWDCIDNDKIKLDFQSSVLLLDQIQKSLSKYLEQKRSYFPRFYFVSDEELIEILAQTKNPQQIQRHIYKCFEGIFKLQFSTASCISGMYSAQEELVPLEQKVDVIAGSKNGNVELWLQELQVSMKQGIRQLLSKTILDLNSTKMEYISQWPCQCILLANYIKWTRNTESAIRGQHKLTLKIFNDLLQKELQETVLLVRQEQRTLQKITLEAMVVMEVHAKDIVYNLWKKNVESIQEFEWISQLRYYLTEDVQVKMVNACFNYGYEYLGTVTRLVTTQLTDRCYRTLLGALHMNYGGAPEGPAGTGKSETVKDLAKAVAMQCIVFNCSDGLNYIAMGKFFKGLASSGAWCCFDEFNRIDPEVLSVVAQQIFTIQKAIKQQKQKFIFEGEEISLIVTCAINVTMNPGYAGRSELPDNLKILFRPCAMIVPDYAMISEIYLYSVGFERARDLSAKIVACLKLCSEQLSPQEHYDFGMRTLKAILNTAKNMFEGTEEQICLTSLIHVNKPKFLHDDIQLFMSITGDLFPNVQQLDNAGMNLEDQCIELNLYYEPNFVEKCHHLQNTVSVRNGVMCIGKTYSGKSSVILTLSKSLGIQSIKINPKAVNCDQLYGKLDPDTKQWSDGVAPILIREHLSKPTWLIFDGPVDSMWIENLNTVLDDNKKLCLTSGEILKIPKHMCMLFEVEDLSVASPATISRCGMIYFTSIHWYLLLQSFQTPGGLDQDYFVRRLRFLIDPVISWCKLQIMPVYQNFNINVSNCLNLLYICLDECQDTRSIILDNLMIFCIVWSFGGTLDEKCRSEFNIILHKICAHRHGLETEYPDDNVEMPQNPDINYFEHYFKEFWIRWSDMQPAYQVKYDMTFHEIIVPTSESIRNDHFCQMNLHMLFCGPTGTGKSLAMQKFSQYQITCSGQTTANQIQKLIESKVNKRRRKAHYSAEEGHISIFIDDLNMPHREIHGAQPAIELLRQWMDQGGWYDLETKEFKYMCDITFIAALQPASGGRNSVSLRYLRHYHLLYLNGFDNQSMSKILNVFFDWIILKINPSTEVVNLKDVLVNNTIRLYDQLQTKLLPTPTKSHYLYNIRDVLKIYQGLSKVTQIKNPSQLSRIWAHECLRVFSDRLIDKHDLLIFEGLLRDNLISYNNIDFNNLIFTDIIHGHYEEVDKLQILKNKLQSLLDEYNTVNQSNRIQIILFNNAICHITRIVRILSSDKGNALLVGMGGSGRMSLSKLANYIQFNEQLLKIDTRYWEEQLVAVLKEVGLENVKKTLLFNDSQFSKESLLEDVCNILSHGEIPHLFPPEERLKISEEMQYQEFVANCRMNIHIILCMQPVGELFRRRLRMFPTIINDTTIDWFSGWPPEALESTAQTFLPASLVKMAVESHNKILEVTDRYQQELRRHFYVTPTQYLQMLHTFKRLYNDKTDSARVQIDRYETGIEKINQTERDVDKIRQVLFDLQPKLEKSTLDNLQLLNNIKKKQLEADLKRKICEQDERDCTIKREEANGLRNLCQQQLNNVLPLLSNATEALEKITKDDMIQLKSFTNPPPSAAIVMQGLCYAFQEDGNVKSKTKEPISTQDFWNYAKKYLLNDKLIKKIKDMKIDAIRAIHISKIQKLQVFVQNPFFEKEKVFNASKAAGNLAAWIRAVLETYEAVEIIEPKKVELHSAELNLQKAEEQVKEKMKALNESLQFLKQLSDEYEKYKKEKEEIERKVEQIQAQLQRAEQLTNGLSEEKVRWRRKAQNFKNEQNSIEGDCILSSAIIAYLGVFPIQYRDQCLDYWKFRLKHYQVRFSEDYSIQKHLCNPVQVNIWINQKLPNDQFSIDNAIILKQSPRWPLIIDPQMQANEWIKMMEDPKSLVILNATQTQSQVFLQLEHAIQIGYSVLLENIGQTIDEIYQAILEQKLIKKGNKLQMKFGDKLIDYQNDFKFYMTTKLNNPHYQPQVCVMVTMLNFQVTLEGLTDQMLNIVVKIDEPVKEDQRIKNIQQFFINKNKQQQTEDLILKLLYEAQGNLVENDSLIQTLQTSKAEGQDIEERLKKQELDNQNFNSIRIFYKPAAHTVANLYFVINDLSNLEPTYLWSLEFYIQLYQKAIRESAFGKARRCQNIIDRFASTLYLTINRSLLEKDKLVFRFLLCVRYLDIPTLHVRTCVMGPTLTESVQEMPDMQWMTKKIWLGIEDLQTKYPEIFGFLTEHMKQRQFWDSFYQSANPWKLQIERLSLFYSVMIIKIIKPDKFIGAIQELIQVTLGKMYLETQPTSLESFFAESTSQIPLMCLVTPGADPRVDIQNLADKFHNDKFNAVSLGQGQVQNAVKLIKNGMQHGRWVLLQNCHVASSFMAELEALFELKEVHKDYRLWLTSLPTNILPHNIVLKSLKMTYELPRGLKNNMLRAYNIPPEELELEKRPSEYKCLYFSLSLFHSCLLERRKFGALGWNIPYNFSSNDLEISKEQLKYFLENFNEIQWEALNYLIAETHYGGRITDPQDRKLLKVLLLDFLHADICEGFQILENYQIPFETNHKGYVDYINTLPIHDPGYVFGLHPNAEIYSTILEANNLSSSVLSLLPRSIGVSQNSDKIVMKNCVSIYQSMPPLFDLDMVNQKYPLFGEDSLNTVLQQELQRYNRLIEIMRTTLDYLIKSLEGLLPTSDQSQELYNRVFDNQVPEIWTRVSFLSIRPLGSWIIDLQERLKFLRSWIEQKPECFWLGGFFFIQSFLTGNLQNYSRKNKIAIDQLKFDFAFHEKYFPVEDSFFVSGVYIDGAKFDLKKQLLDEPDHQVLHYKAPYIRFIPKIQISEYNSYPCPLYNTPVRKGSLSTVGYSVNYILKVRVPIAGKQEHWIKRGVAMIVQMD